MFRISLSLLLVTLGLTAACTSTSAVAPLKPSGAIDSAYPPALVELNFQSHGKRLNGILYQANGKGPHPTVILLHGYPGNEKNLDLAQDARSLGYNVLFFHYRGAWGSGGEFSMSHVIEDVTRSIAFLRQAPADYRVDPSRLIITGHSMGGFAALQGAALDPAIECVAAIAPANPGLMGAAISSDPVMAKRIAQGANNLPMLNGWNAQAALTDLSENAQAFDVFRLGPALSGKRVLLIAGDQDKVLPIPVFHEPLVEAYERQSGLELTHQVLSGDHAFSWSRKPLIDTVLNWMQGCYSD